MKCSDIECCQNDHLLLLCIPMQYVGPLNPFWGGNGKIRFPNSRISLVYTDIYYRFLLTNRVSASDKCDFFLTINEKYRHSIK